jgi:hypothetical protein
MPATSRKQQRYLAWRFGPAWLRAHHFDVLASARSARKKRKGNG